MVPDMQNETDRMFCHFRPVFVLLPPIRPPNDIKQSKFWKKKKKWKKCMDIYINVYHKWTSYDIWFLKCKVRQTSFCHFGSFFAFQCPDNPESQNFKIEKSTRRYYHFTHLYHTWQSYDVCFLRYGAWQTEFFVILDRFLPFYPPNNPKNQNLKNEKNTYRYYHFTHVYHKWQSYDV